MGSLSKREHLNSAIHKWLFSAISASDSDIRARSNVPLHTQLIPAVKMFVFLDLAESISFPDDTNYIQWYGKLEMWEKYEKDLKSFNDMIKSFQLPKRL